ncbi:MAG: hypothetical protein EP332_14925 [Bacteroidetes bacterium]|nr:MAG: hypothetical protein EP332_14925 [Bacteroidota bacterium]
MKRFLPLLLVFFFTELASAQAYLGFHYGRPMPLNQLNDSNYKSGHGFGFDLMSNNILRRSSLDFRLGASFEYYLHGTEKRDILLNTPNSDPGIYSVQNNHMGILLTSRVSFLNESFVSPFIDGFVGTRIFKSTESILPKADYIEGFEPTHKNVHSTSAFHYGFSAGLLFNVNESFAIDTRLSYSNGAQANWVKLQSAALDGNQLKYNSTQTFTDLFIFRIGVIIRVMPSYNSDDREYSDDESPDYSPSLPSGGRPLEPKPNNSPVPVTPKPAP